MPVAISEQSAKSYQGYNDVMTPATEDGENERLERFECDCLATGVGTEKFQQWSVPGTGKLVVVFQG